MKITYYFYNIIFLFCISTYSQNIELGFRTGLNLSTLRTGDNTGTDFTGSTQLLTRLNLSVVSEYRFSNHFNIEASLGYQGKGGKDFDEISVLRTGIEDFQRKIEYLNGSFLLRYYPLNSNKVKPFLTIGSGFSYLLIAKELGNKIDKENINNSFDISTIAGIGGKFSVGGNFSFEILGGIDRGWNRVLKQRNQNRINEVFESLFNEIFWVSIGIKKKL